MAANERKKVSFLDRAIEQATADQRPLGREDDPARTKWPELWKWLATTDVSGNRVKEPATLTLRLGPEGALATLNDRALGYAIDVAVPYLADLLAAMETALNSDSTPVRRNTRTDPKIRKRKSSS